MAKHDTSDRNGVRDHTLLDPALGCTSEFKSECSVCGHTSESCPGHFGVVELTETCFNPIYINILLSILRCVCFQCAKIHTIVPPSLSSKLAACANGSVRFKSIRHLCKPSNVCAHCKESLLRWKATKKDGFLLSYGDNKVSPKQVVDVLKKLGNDDVRLLGFDARHTRPENLLFETMPVCPNSLRPQVIRENGARGENDLTHRYSDVVRENTRMAEDVAQEREVTAQRSNALQYFVSAVGDSDSKVPRNVCPHVRKSSKGIRQRIEIKDGHARRNCMGKRCDFSARSVITPGPFLMPGQVSVPKQILFNQFFSQTVVDERTRQWLQEVVDLGPDTLDGARFIKKWPSGKVIDLRIGDKNSHMRRLNIGDVVERYYHHGDSVQFNRQPTLHDVGIMGPTIVESQHKTIGMNSATCTAFNGDFDGDEMNLHFPQSEESHAEVSQMHPSVHVVSITTSAPIIYPVQDTILGMWVLLNEFPTLTLDEKTRFLSKLRLDSYDHPLSSGHDLFSITLPALFNFEWASPKLTVKNGVVQQDSTINKANLCSGSGSVLHKIYMLFGPKVCETFIYNIQMLSATALNLHPVSFGPGVIVQPEGFKNIGKTINSEAKSEVSRLLD